MRFRDFSGIKKPLNNEEVELVRKIKRTLRSQIKGSELTERELEVARLMTSKGLLKRSKTENDILYQIL